MELLLNLTWLLLALPAYWLWRERIGVRQRRRFSSSQCLLALSCLLVVLFPVVSATDDLHAMRAEMEESSINKRGIRQASNERPSTGKWHSYVALTSAPPTVFPPQEGWHVSPPQDLVIPAGSVFDQPGRAPPIS